VKIWRSYREKIIFLALLLSAIGLFNVFNSSYILAMNNENNPYFFFLQQAKALVGGLLLALVLCSRKINYQKLNNIRLQYGFSLVVIILLIAVEVVGISVNGSQRWLKFGITFQPSELAKLSAIFLTAAYIDMFFRKKDSPRYISLFTPPVAVTLVIFALVFKQPDLGTAIVIALVCFSLYLVAGLRSRVVIGLIVSVVLMSVPLIIFASYRLDRIRAWWDPWQYAQGIGYQACQSMLTIGSGKIFGMQFGMGLSKFFYLPEAHTDFAFAIWAQEAGFIGAVLLVALFFMFAQISVTVAMKTTDVFGRMLAIGITLLIAGQALINVAMVTGLLPVVGVPLPFISFGGTSLVINWIAIGILANIAGKIQEDKRVE
jgi:cell division protein FtsW